MMLVLRIQGAFRAKKARKAMLAKRGEVAAKISGGGADGGGGGAAGDKPAHNWTEVWEPKYKQNYYFNSVTKESVWEKPAEMLRAEKENAAAAAILEDDDDDDDNGRGGYQRFLMQQFDDDDEFELFDDDDPGNVPGSVPNTPDSRPASTSNVALNFGDSDDEWEFEA